MTSNQKILIIAYYFPPMGGVGVQRVLSLIKYLPRHGFDLVVLTSEPGVHKVMDKTLLDVETSGHCKVVRIGGRKLHRDLARAALGGVQRIVSRLKLLRYLKFMDIYAAWSSEITDEAVAVASREGIDLIYSTSPPHSTHLLAWQVSRRLQLPWIMELRDSMSVWPLRRPGLATAIQSRIESYYESRLYQAADGVIFVTDTQRVHARRRVEALSLEKTAVITNGFDESVRLPEVSMRTEQSFRITYTGSLSDFDISVVCKAISAFSMSDIVREQRIRFIIVGSLDADNRRILESLGEKVDLDLVGVVPYMESLAYQVNADCLLLLQTANYGDTGSEILTGKVFEYIASRRPILAAAIPGDLTDLIKDNDFGAVADPFDEKGIIDALGTCYQLARDPVWQSQRTQRDLRSFSRGCKASQTADFIRRIVGGRSAG